MAAVFPVAENTPCIIGVAQKTWRPSDGDAPEPLLQWEAICHAAAKDCGAENVLTCIDELNVVYSIAWQYDDAAEQLAQKLRLKPGRRQISGLSGTSPQFFLQQAALNILEGKLDVALIVGAEALATKKRAKKANRQLEWPQVATRKPPPYDDPFHPSEIAHNVFAAHLTFALLDSARRARLGLSLDENRYQQAHMMAQMSSIAAQNPNAWFQQPRTARDIAEITLDNPIISYPFSKYSMAMMDVDMAAALIVTSHKQADELGVPQEKRVYIHSSAFTKAPVHMAQRDILWHSPALQAACDTALERAQISISDVDYLDLYSCFPSSVNFTKDALAINDTDSRSLTLTGGLPYFGGPGNNYCTHSVAAMVEKCRSNPQATGLVSGVGMHMTNHVVGIYSATPPGKQTAENFSTVTVDQTSNRIIDEEASGPAVIVAYSVTHSQGERSGLAICDLPNKHRCYARVSASELLDSMEIEEWVGREVVLETREKVNTVTR